MSRPKTTSVLSIFNSRAEFMDGLCEALDREGLDGHREIGGHPRELRMSRHQADPWSRRELIAVGPCN